MQRGLAALVCAGLLMVGLTGTVSAAKVSRFTDQYVQASCSGTVDGGFVNAFADHSGFGASAALDLWLDPASPDTDPPSVTGFSDQVDVTAVGSGFTLAASWSLTDADGNPLGDGSMTATMARVGDPVTEAPSPKTNHHNATTVIDQDLAGTATLDVLGVTYAVACSGIVQDFDVHEANPTSFVSSNAGVQMDCFWTSADEFVELFVVKDDFGFFANAVIANADGELDGIGGTGSIDASGVNVAIDLLDFATGDTATATGVATFALLGDPVTSWLTQQNSQTKVVEQALTPTGSFEVSTGASYPIDREHCAQTETFVNHSVTSQPQGPKSGPAPANDTPDGAIRLKLGAKFNTSTTSTALDPEVEDFSLCPQGISDSFGHTLWYTVVGTGGPITIDTSGSGFDTVVKAFTRDGDTFTAVGCEDDVALQPIGASYQAVLTIDTLQGQTYYIEAGGFRRFFQPDLVQSGRLRLAIR